MKFNKLKFLCDENIDTEAIDFMKSIGLDVVSAKQLRLAGKGDKEILKKSYKTNRVVLTHDNDFGKIIYSEKINLIGVMYIRPGHFGPEVTINTIKTLMKADLSFEPPFMMVTEQKTDTIKVRLRNNL